MIIYISIIADISSEKTFKDDPDQNILLQNLMIISIKLGACTFLINWGKKKLVANFSRMVGSQRKKQTFSIQK